MGDNDKSVAAPGKARVRVRLLDAVGRPIAGANCIVNVGNESPTATTDARGILDLFVTSGVPNSGNLEIKTREGLTFSMPLRIVSFGEPQQPDGSRAVTTAGARARLNNLGYLPLDIATKLDDPIDANLTRGIERFQFANKIIGLSGSDVGKASGQLDRRTQNRMVAAHDTETGDFVQG